MTSSVEPDSPAMTRTQQRAAANRQAVLDAAREIIATRGVDALTLEAVAERADVVVQTIYNRVGGRSALIVAVAEQALEESRLYMDEAYDSSDDLEIRLRRAAASYARFARERPHEFRVLVEPPSEPKAVARIAEITRTQNARLASIFQSGIEVGLVRPELDPDTLATAMWATMNGLLALAWRPGALHAEPTTLDELVRVYVDVISDGLKPR